MKHLIWFDGEPAPKPEHRVYLNGNGRWKCVGCQKEFNWITWVSSRLLGKVTKSPFQFYGYCVLYHEKAVWLHQC